MEKTADEVLVFVQAAADVPYALGLCNDASRSGSRVHLVVVTVESVYDFLVSLGLDAVSVDFIPCLLLSYPRQPWRILQVRPALSRLFRQLFAGRKYSKAYFFCAQHDVVTPYFIRRLAETTPVFVADHYGMPMRNEVRWPLRVVLRWLYLRVVTGVWFDFAEAEQVSTSYWISTFRTERLGIKTIRLQPCAPLLLTTGLWLGGGKEPTVLFLDDDHEKSPEMLDYSQTVLTLVQTLRDRGVKVCLKAHPRSGYSKCLAPLNLPTLPAGCPVELLDIRNMAAVISLNSLGLARTAKEGQLGLSILDIVAFRSEEVREWWRRWIDRHSDNRVLYPKNLEELVELVIQSPVLQGELRVQ
jgi:hypothetical protein